MARIIVTGAAGFIGSHSTEFLLSAGHTVLGLDNFRTGHRRNLAIAGNDKRFSFVEGDVAAPGFFAEICREFRPVAAVHLAALVSVPESIAHPEENDRLNRYATVLLAEAARETGIKRLVFASSAAVYGNDERMPLREELAGRPASPYGAAKLQSEAILLEWARQTGGTARIHRYFNVYGPRQDPSSPYSGVISRFESALLQGRRATINGDGRQTRDFIAVADVARANLLAATKADLGTGVANICTGRSVSILQLHSTMARLWGRNDSTPAHNPPRAGDIRHSCGDPALAARDLGFQAEIDLEDGLRRMLPSSGN